MILIFSVNKSGAFQGVARMTSVADPNKTTADPWINDGDDPENHTQKYGGIFGIQW